MLKNRQYEVLVDFFNTDTINTDMTFKQFDYGTSTIKFITRYKGNNIELQEGEQIIVVFQYKNNVVANKVEDNTKYNIPRSMDEEGNIVVNVPKQILKNQGTVHCEIVILNELNGNRKTSPNITFSIVKSLIDLEHLNNGE